MPNPLPGKPPGFGNRVQVVVAPEKDHLGVARGMADKQDFVLNTVLSFLQTHVKE